MALDAVIARFIEHSPVTVMARLALGRALDAQWMLSGSLSGSLSALYDKVTGTEPGLVRALVAGSAARLAPVIEAMSLAPLISVPGYRVRILDGRRNVAPSSQASSA